MKFTVVFVWCILIVLAIGTIYAQAGTTTSAPNTDAPAEGSTSTKATAAPPVDTKPTATPKPTVTTKDPVLIVNEALNNASLTCQGKETTFCKFIADGIVAKPTKDEKCLLKDEWTSCVKQNCTNSAVLQWNIDIFAKFCNSASLFSVSPMLLCYLAVVCRLIYG